MDYYQNAVETEQAACVLYETGMYHQAIYFYCLAMELYLKSRLHLVEHKEKLEFTHDIEGLYHALNARFKPSVNIDAMISRSRKYFNESRYPYAGDTNAYTRAFADEFIGTITGVKNYIDNDCLIQPL